MGRITERLDALEKRMDELEDELLRRPRPGRPATKLAEAIEWLNEVLSTPVKFAEIRRVGKNKGFSMPTLRKAAEEVGVERRKGYWSFPARMTRNNYIRAAVLEAVHRPRKAGEVIEELSRRFPTAKVREFREWAKRLGMDRGLLWYPFDSEEPGKRKVSDREIREWFKKSLPMSHEDLEKYRVDMGIDRKQLDRATDGIEIRNVFGYYMTPEQFGEYYMPYLGEWLVKRLKSNVGAKGQYISILKSQIMQEAGYQGAESRQHVIAAAKANGINTSAARWKWED